MDELTGENQVHDGAPTDDTSDTPDPIDTAHNADHNADAAGSALADDATAGVATPALWAARRPGVPLDEPSDTTKPQPKHDVIEALCSWIDAELARVADLVAGIDVRVDPSTIDTARRLSSELTDLRDRCRGAT
jgi:hypothetical protein